MKQISYKNKEKYKLGDFKLILYQVLMSIVWQTVRRITDEIWQWKG